MYSERGLACKLRQMNVEFVSVFLDYMYLPGETYQAEYVQDGFFATTLVAIKERLMQSTGRGGRRPAIFLPATAHILATLCRSAKTVDDDDFTISLLDEKIGRDQNLLYRATVEMKCSNKLFMAAFCGKSKNHVSSCKPDVLSSLLEGDVAAKNRLKAVCVPLAVEDAVGTAAFIKLERKVVAVGD